MPRSPFQIAFDHYDECPECNYADRRLCRDGKALFDAALKAATTIAGLDVERPAVKA